MNTEINIEVRYAKKLLFGHGRIELGMIIPFVPIDFSFSSDVWLAFVSLFENTVVWGDGDETVVTGATLYAEMGDTVEKLSVWSR